MAAVARPSGNRAVGQQRGSSRPRMPTSAEDSALGQTMLRTRVVGHLSHRNAARVSSAA